MKYNTQYMIIILDIVLIKFRLVLDGIWCKGKRDALMRNNPERVSNVQKTKPNETSEKGLRVMLTCQSALLAQLYWCQQCATTGSVTIDTSFSLLWL